MTNESVDETFTQSMTGGRHDDVDEAREPTFQTTRWRHENEQNMDSPHPIRSRTNFQPKRVQNLKVAPEINFNKSGFRAEC
jgi:hypothetical protein